MTTALAPQHRLADTEYHISLERLSELNRSPAPLLLARLNSACPSYGKTPANAADPVRLMAEIRRHCKDDADFIAQSMPLQEIVFRTLLLNGVEPMTLGQLHHELTERWSSPLRPISVTVSGLARILDSDRFYGFESIPVEEPEPEPAAVEEFDAAPMLDAAPTDAELASLAAAIVSNLDDEDDDDDDDADDYEDDDPDEDDDADNGDEEEEDNDGDAETED